MGCQELATGSRIELRAHRVLVAAGPIGSTALLQRSELVPRSRTILDSALTVVPVAFLGRPAGTDEPGHALAQLFFRLDGRDGCQRPASVQVYAPDPSLAERIRSLRPTLSRVLGPVTAPALRSMFMAFVYLHSDLSEAARCDTDATGTGLSRLTNDHTATAIRRIIGRWGRAIAPSGLLPLTPLRHQVPVGQGFHVGGSLPMRRQPGRGQTDLVGRPHGLRRIHVVDASLFPTIPAGPITYSIMANATRIADIIATGIDSAACAPAPRSRADRV